MVSATLRVSHARLLQGPCEDSFLLVGAAPLPLAVRCGSKAPQPTH